ncbi:tetratricopeptide repeat protein [Vibrio maerlii]|uniref:tetratricopeptide repeat protein n=1 Tax=Vibrio maerlii TaxID=2231648 RepID=UPI000E3C735F|nr:tetratricopeptide repeat protein [Vibrio maerlii]
MSAINKALSDLATQESAQAKELKLAEIPKVKRFSPKLWLGVGIGFSLSIGVGSWAMSQQQKSIVTSSPVQSEATEVPRTVVTVDVVDVEPSSPTNKVVESQVEVFSRPESKTIKTESLIASTVSLESTAKKTATKTTDKAPVKVADSPKVSVEKKITQVPEPFLIAKNSTPQKNNGGSIVIEKVQLTPTQLAEQSVQRAEKALDSNELEEALNHYQRALRYTPNDEIIRQKLAALYYGKKDPSKAFDLLQEGIKLNEDSERLRLNLSQLLIKEGQEQAALTPLVHLSEQPSIKYLSMRAALAQKLKQQDIALTSYQQLVKLDESNGRWWLGLGIQLERSKQFAEAKTAYTNALGRMGISSKSQAFIQDRLSLLNSLEGNPNAN